MVEYNSQKLDYKYIILNHLEKLTSASTTIGILTPDGYQNSVAMDQRLEVIEFSVNMLRSILPDTLLSEDFKKQFDEADDNSDKQRIFKKTNLLINQLNKKGFLMKKIMAIQVPKKITEMQDDEDCVEWVE